MKIDHLVRKLEQFGPLCDDDKAALENAAADIVEYAAKQDIISQGDRPVHVHLLLEGWACRYKILPDGERQIMAFLIPGDLCDIHVTLLDRMDHSISALSACKLLSLPLEYLSGLMRKNDRLSRALSWTTLVDEAILREWLVNLGRRQSEKRLGHLICEMLLRSKAVGLSDGNSFEMPLTQEELADTMGLTPQHMNKCFQTLKGKGLISTQRKQLFVENFEKLVAFSEFDPTYLHQMRDQHEP